jgi:hypothetical protein
MTVLNITVIAVLFIATILAVGKYDFEKNHAE